MVLFDGPEDEANLRHNLSDFFARCQKLQQQGGFLLPAISSSPSRRIAVRFEFFSSDMAFSWKMFGVESFSCLSCDLQSNDFGSREAFANSHPHVAGTKSTPILPSALTSIASYKSEILHNGLRAFDQFLLVQVADAAHVLLPSASNNAVRKNWKEVFESVGATSLRFSRAEGQKSYSIAGIQGSAKIRILLKQLFTLEDFQLLLPALSQQKQQENFEVYQSLCLCLQISSEWCPSTERIELLQTESSKLCVAYMNLFGGNSITPHLHQILFENYKMLRKHPNLACFSTFHLEHKNSEISSLYQHGTNKRNDSFLQILHHLLRQIVNPLSNHCLLSCDIDGQEFRTRTGMNSHFAVSHPLTERGKAALAKLATNKAQRAEALQRKQQKQQQQQQQDAMEEEKQQSDSEIEDDGNEEGSSISSEDEDEDAEAKFNDDDDDLEFELPVSASSASS
jgi:hypothetical protein